MSYSALATVEAVQTISVSPGITLFGNLTVFSIPPRLHFNIELGAESIGT